MSRKYFGTDGIRGIANKAPVDAETAMRVGMAAGAHFTKGTHRHRVVIGKDTRLSGYLIEPALTAGFVSMGMDVILVGPMPSPAVSMLTKSLRADLGVMISASHNPYHDNGIKFFDSTGRKLSDTIETTLESLMDDDLTQYLAPADKLGRAHRLEDAAGRYVEYIKATFPKNKRLDGLKIVIDCANGAAYKLAPSILWELGAEIIQLSTTPNGYNINQDCGSTFTNPLRAKVIETEADIGIALDGDADRVVVCDEKGQIIDGDQIMGAIASYWHSQGRLQGGGLVATVMSNLGLERFLNDQDLTLERSQVGDRYVIEKMEKGNYNLGGEQSGHVIFSDYTPTGDGTLGALQLLAILVETNLPASKILRVFDPFPQILRNVRYKADQQDPLTSKDVQTVIKRIEKNLGNTGRVLIRKSGTEPLIRVMVEGANDKEIRIAADEIIAAIENFQSKNNAQKA